MLYFALGITISLTNLSAPLSCLAQLFWWRDSHTEILTEVENENQVPQTVDEMRKLIKELKSTKV